MKWTLLFLALALHANAQSPADKPSEPGDSTIAKKVDPKLHADAIRLVEAVGAKQSLQDGQLVSQSSQALPIGSSQRIRLQIESTLQRYLAACVRRSLPELLAVWPDLQNKKRDYDKIKRHLADPSVSREEMTIELLEIQSTHDGALVRVHRTEKFVETKTASVGGVAT